MKTPRGESAFELILKLSSQNVVFITTSEDPFRTSSNASPLGKGGELLLTNPPNGPNFFSTVEFSGLVLSTFSLSPSRPSTPKMVALVVIWDVAIPPSVATFTREMNVFSSMSMICTAGPTSFNDAGIASVMEKI